MPAEEAGGNNSFQLEAEYQFFGAVEGESETLILAKDIDLNGRIKLEKGGTGSVDFDEGGGILPGNLKTISSISTRATKSYILAGTRTVSSTRCNQTMKVCFSYLYRTAWISLPHFVKDTNFLKHAAGKTEP